MYPSVLKSDQNGIEMENKQLERVKRENRLKSDQNGIEIIMHVIRVVPHSGLKSDQNGIEMWHQTLTLISLLIS